MPKISLIIPIYNNEQYLKDCLDSAVNQTFKDIEIILADDGSTDGSLEISEEYAKKDPRIRIVRNGNGFAANIGLEAAAGDYISIVRADDRVEADMCEKLYNQITKFDADVCIGSFYEYYGNSMFANGEHDKPCMEIIQNTNDKKLFTISDYPFLYTMPLWSTLYKSDFIKSIKFSKTVGNEPFITEVLCKSSKLSVVHDFLYHCRIDAMSCEPKKDKSLQTILDSLDSAKTILKKYDKFQLLKEEYYFNVIQFYRNIPNKYKKTYFKRVRAFLSDLKEDEQFSCKYFTPVQKRIFEYILDNNFRASLFDDYKGINIFGIPLIEKTERNGIKKIRIFNIPIYYKTSKNCYTIRKYLFGLLKTKRSCKNRKLYLFGIQILSKKYPYEDETHNNMRMQYYENLAQRHHTVIFKKYNNLYLKKDLVIFACGSSVKYYQTIKDAVHISINRAFYFQNVKFDYMFFHDLNFVNENLEAIKNYDADKFCAYHTKQPNASRFNTPSEKLKYINAKRFYLSYSRFNLDEIIPDIINPDISSGMFYERGGGTVFSALQFALYTHPKRIYLVGCDCSEDGYFYLKQNKLNKNLLLKDLYKCWVEASYSMQALYPDIEIISINPVRLKGLFKDVYTQSYIDEHPDLLQEESLEILPVKEVVHA